MATAVARVESVLLQLGQSKQLAHLFNICKIYAIISFFLIDKNSYYSSCKSQGGGIPYNKGGDACQKF